jgi:hypothetical protein
MNKNVERRVSSYQKAKLSYRKIDKKLLVNGGSRKYKERPSNKAKTNFFDNVRRFEALASNDCKKQLF